MNNKTLQILSVSGLVVGNLIGAGILALPIGLGLAGTIPAIISLIIFTLFMLFTANILAKEAAESKNPTFDYPSLYEKYLGKIGKWIAVITNEIILYGFLIAYISGATKILTDVLNIPLPAKVVSIIFFVIALTLTLLDLKIINKYNSVLIICLFLAFCGLILCSAPSIKTSNLSGQHWEYFWFTVPLILAAAHFHNIIPTLCKDLNYDLLSLNKAMAIGMGIAFLMNAGWTICGTGCLERLGDNGIINAYLNNLPATVPIGNMLNSKVFTATSLIFALVAIVTSFITNGLGLMSFIRDLLYNTFNIDNKFLVKFITFAPPILIALIWPNIFIVALNIVGGIGIVTLFAILPSIIALKKQTFNIKYKIMAILTLILSSIAFIVVIFIQFNIGDFKVDPTKEIKTTNYNALYNINKENIIYEITKRTI